MRRLILLFMVVLVASGCGGFGEATTTSLAMQPIPTTTVVPTTTTLPSTTVPTTITSATATSTVPLTTAGATRRQYVIGEPGVYPRPDTPTGPLPDSDGAGGAGCAPNSTALPDGVWFGIVTAKTETSISFDLACFFFGPIALEEGASDGVAVDPDNEIYIRNANPTVRTITVDQSVLVYEYLVDLTDTIEVPFSSVPFADWPADPTFSQPCPGGFCGVWLFVNDSMVTEI